MCTCIAQCLALWFSVHLLNCPIKQTNEQTSKQETRETLTGLTLVAFNCVFQANTNILIYSLVLLTNHYVFHKEPKSE